MIVLSLSVLASPDPPHLPQSLSVVVADCFAHRSRFRLFISTYQSLIQELQSCIVSYASRGLLSFSCYFAVVTVPAKFSVAQMVGGTISGVVLDPSSAPLDQARVVIRNEETATERDLTTAGDGTFSAPSIAVGIYSISVEKDGFAPLKRTGISVAVAQHIQLRLPLTVGAVQQIVTVVDTPAAVDTSTLQTSGLVTERQVKDLPLNGRSFDQLLELNPASVSYTTQRSGRRRNLKLLRRQHVFHLRTPAAGQSLPAERNRVHRRFADQRHSRRHQRPVAWRRGRARIQRRQRHLRS